jgi:hypothetical protein
LGLRNNGRRDEMDSHESNCPTNVSLNGVNVDHRTPPDLADAMSITSPISYSCVFFECGHSHKIKEHDFERTGGEITLTCDSCKTFYVHYSAKQLSPLTSKCVKVCDILEPDGDGNLDPSSEKELVLIQHVKPNNKTTATNCQPKIGLQETYPEKFAQRKLPL